MTEWAFTAHCLLIHCLPSLIGVGADMHGGVISHANGIFFCLTLHARALSTDGWIGNSLVCTYECLSNYEPITVRNAEGMHGQLETGWLTS